MTNISQFSSRKARLSCSGEEFFTFITDLRNFGQFIPANSANEWRAEENSCSFSMAPMGTITLSISSKTKATNVSFSGNVLVTTSFMLHVSIEEDENTKASVKLLMEAELNPMLRAMAKAPIERFLETLVKEMENFRDWRR